MFQATKQRLQCYIIVKGEAFFKVTGSHVHWKCGNISEAVLD